MRTMTAIAVYLFGCVALVMSLCNSDYKDRRELTPKESSQLLFSVLVVMSALCLIYWKLVRLE